VNPAGDAAGATWVWDLPGGASAAVGIAVLAALLCLVLAVRALRRRPGSRRLPAWGAALARAGAVAAAVLAAAGPRTQQWDGRVGERVVAAHADAAPEPDADRTLRWPDDVPDAVAALETLRAAGPADEPLALMLATGGDVPTGAAAERALRQSALAAVSVRADELPRRADAEPPRPAPHLAAPSGATEGIPASLELQSLDAPFEAAEARLRVGEREGTFSLPDGRRRALSPPVDLPAGTHLARIDVPGRAPALAFVEVAPAPQVTYVAEGASGHPLVATLAAQGLPVAALEPADAAREGFGDPDVLILGPGARGTPLAARVEGRVRSGCGLLVLGGAGDDGLRRHADSPVAALLPVVLPPPPPEPPPPEPDPPEPTPRDEPEEPPTDENPDVRMDDGPKEALRVALLLVIDRSGSMAGPKMRMAQMSAMAAARSLSAEDRVGILAFDDRTKWIAPFQSAGDLNTLSRRVGGLRAEGGTDFFPALRQGFAEIGRQKCGIRHVILLSDGATRAAVFRPTVEAAAEQSITLSTIAIGDGADTRLLGLLAGWGKGRLYLANNPERLPEVVTVDTRRFTVEERERRLDEMEKPEGLPELPTEPGPPDDPTADATDPPTEPGPPEPTEPETVPPRVPRILATAAFLEGLVDAEWPALPHPEDPEGTRGVALAVLGWEQGAPALVLGRSGDARVAVLAADTATSDASQVFAWEGGAPFLAQLVRSLAEPPDPAGGGVLATVTRALDGSARIAVPIDADGTLRLRPEGGGEEQVVACGRMGGAWTGGRLASTPAAGVWSGIFVPSAEGVPPREVALVSQGAARPAPRALDGLAEAAGAPLVDTLPAALPAPPGERREPASAPLLGGAAALLLLEALFRRLA
jgi:hypothetical protein